MCTSQSQCHQAIHLRNTHIKIQIPPGTEGNAMERGQSMEVGARLSNRWRQPGKRPIGTWRPGRSPTAHRRVRSSSRPASPGRLEDGLATGMDPGLFPPPPHEIRHGRGARARCPRAGEGEGIGRGRAGAVARLGEPVCGRFVRGSGWKGNACVG